MARMFQKRKKMNKKFQRLKGLWRRIVRVITLLLRIYTPFIAGLYGILFWVMCLMEKDPMLYLDLSPIAGHSLLFIADKFAHSRRMCKWYKMTLYALFIQDVISLLYAFTHINTILIAYTALIATIAAIICFIIYRCGKGIFNFLRY